MRKTKQATCGLYGLAIGRQVAEGIQEGCPFKRRDRNVLFVLCFCWNCLLELLGMSGAHEGDGILHIYRAKVVGAILHQLLFWYKEVQKHDWIRLATDFSHIWTAAA